VHFKKNLCSALLAISLLITACGGAGSDTTPTPEPQAVLTAAAQTAQAKMTELAAKNPSPLPPTPTPTSTTPTVTATLGTATTAAPPAAGGGSDRVEFVADLTVPDGTVFRPGEKFTKTWRLMNAGTSTWTTAYSLVFSSGEQMGGSATTALTVQVPPGQTLDLSVQLTAPSGEGKHTGYWMLRNASGTNFGMGARSDGAFYVQINVSGTAGTSTPGTAIATTTGDEDGTQATLSVDESDVVGPCPHSFSFTGLITISEAATVTYVLEVEADIPLNVPGPTTTNLGAGTSQMSYTLELTDSANGSVTLHVTSPEDVRSETIGFTLTCQ